MLTIVWLFKVIDIFFNLSMHRVCDKRALAMLVSFSLVLPVSAVLSAKIVCGKIQDKQTQSSGGVCPVCRCLGPKSWPTGGPAHGGRQTADGWAHELLHGSQCNLNDALKRKTTFCCCYCCRCFHCFHCCHGCHRCLWCHWCHWCHWCRWCQWHCWLCLWNCLPILEKIFSQLL